MNRPRIYDGSGHAPPETLHLRAGKLTMRYENGSLRYLCVGGVELLRMVYAAVRDHNWGTIPGVLTLREQTIEADSFRLVFEMHHQQAPVDFVWTGTITGSSDSSVRFDFDGQANAAFARNRVGFCILHPLEAAGKPCRIEHVDGSITEAAFPVNISPHQPFFGIRAMTHEAAPGVQARVVMEGDTFETEDQRNWTDASFKTYCTPLALPYPVTVRQGERVQQSVRVALVTEQAPAEQAPAEQAPADDAVSTATVITLTEQTVPLPAIGFGVASHDEPLSSGQAERLHALRPAHLRASIRLDEADARAKLKRASDEARAVGSALELALFVSDAAPAELDALTGWLDAEQTPITCFAVLDAKTGSTPVKHLPVIREKLARYGVPIGSGTDGYFTQLNRERPPAEQLDFITYSVNPQVHAFDNTSLVETLAGQAPTVTTARSFGAGKPIHVSPVTLKMRWNPDATAPSEVQADVLPPQVDPRQSSLFGAGWTLGSIKQLAANGVAHATYYETTGWLGVMASEAGSRLPEQFDDTPGGVYPMWHVFERIGAYSGGAMLMTQSSAPLAAEALALRGSGGGFCLMVANFSAEPQHVELVNLPDAPLRLRLLDEQSADAASRDPLPFRSMGQPFASTTLELPAYAIAFIETEPQ